MSRFILILITATAQLWAGCLSLGNNRYYCPSTGNPTADGEALWSFLNAAAFPCGSKIILDAGATYRTHKDGSFQYAFRLKRLACGGNEHTEIISSRLAELPEGRRVTWADLPKMAKLEITNGYQTGSSAALVDLYGSGGLGTQWWALRGIALSSPTGMTSFPGTLVTGGVVFGATTSLSQLPKHILIDRCLAYPGEEETYGPMENATSIAPFFRPLRIAFSFQGEDIVVRESMVKGFGGYNSADLVTTTILAGTNAKPPVLTSPGIAASFGIAPGIPGCESGCTSTCWTGGGCRVAVFEGASGGWTPLNGWHYVVYDTADTVRVYDKFAHATQPDSTSWGPFSGTVTARRGIPNDPAYAVALASCVGCKIINNFLEAWSMTVFTGGNNWEATDHTGTIAPSGSDSSHLVMTAPPQFLAPGDLVKFVATAPSTNYPPKPPSTTNQVCQVVSIESATVTCRPFGSQGMTHPPVAGSIARWNGYQTEGLELRRNWIQRLDAHTLAGKGYIELKNCVNCLIDGNIMTDNPDGNWFVTTRNQAGNDPWIRAENLAFSNNIMGGPLGANNRQTIQGQDDLATNRQSRNVYVRNNLLPEIRFPAGGSSATSILFGGGGILNGGWLHNTFIPASGASAHRGLTPNDCFAAINYLQIRSVRVADNILGYGDGLFGGSPCGWIDQALLTRGNVFLDSNGDVPVAAMQAAWPGNAAVPREADLQLKGHCTFANYDNCELAASSPFKGSATDGKDPGVDLPELKDRIHGWSEEAGLIGFAPTIANAVPRPGAIQTGSNKAIVQFRLLGAGAAQCRFELFRDAARTLLHPDTGSPDLQLCGRSSSVVEEGVVWFVAGASHALSPSTPYYFRITDGNRVLTGSLETNATSAEYGEIVVQVSDPAAASLVVEHASSPAFLDSTVTEPVAFQDQRAESRVPVPPATTVYYRWIKQRADQSVIVMGSTQIAIGQ